MSEHAIANEYRASLVQDLFRREVAERIEEIESRCPKVDIWSFMFGWAVAKGMTIYDAGDFAAQRGAFSQQAAPTASRRLL